MTHPTSPVAPPTRPSSRGGLTLLTLLILAVAAWMTTQQPSSNQTRESHRVPSHALPTELADFHPDAWYLPGETLLGFVEIPAGPFRMGSDARTDRQSFENERWSNTAATGLVELPAFLIGRYEVTIAQYALFVATTGYVVDEQTLQGEPNHPVAMVSWPDALAYCRWLDDTLRTSEQTPGELRRRLEQGWQITLPTEAEWEKAARGTDGRLYPWGNQPPQGRAHFASSTSRAVGSFLCPDCQFSLSDMSGNVWEWTRSPYQPYPFETANDRDNLDADALWVMRGGSFTDTAQNVRAAVRGGADPGARRPFIGFRVVLSPS